MVDKLIAAVVLAAAITLYVVVVNQDIYPLHEAAGRFYTVLTVAFFALRARA
jgi:hypothetical protein